MEQRFSNYLGAGLDLAAILPGSSKVISKTEGTVSPNLYVHWPHADYRGSTWDVYATGGYTALFGDFTGNGVNAGGGAHYWFAERAGVLAEFRVVKVFGADLTKPVSAYYEIRFGVTFR
jgi:hypothetical protein